MLLNNDDRIYVRARPEMRATEFQLICDVRGVRYSYQYCMGWRQMDQTRHLDIEINRLFRVFEEKIKQALNS